MSDRRPREELEAPERRTNWTLVLLLGAVAVLIGVVAFLATRGNSDQDKLTKAEIAKSTPQASREKLCASGATYDLMKRELFRRAAQLRGSDQTEFDRLSGYAVLRVENPVMESQDAATGAANCSGFVSIDLPPGVAVVGGRRTLSSDIDYTVTAAADGSGPVVLLRNADAIVTPLATIGQVNQPAPAAAQEPAAGNEAAPAPQSGPAPSTAPSPPSRPSAPTPPAPPLRPAAGHPSFNCASARRPGEIAVCRDPILAALDRKMAAEYGRAAAVASPEQRALLLDTAHRFYAYRDRCPSDSCIAAAYEGRVREIRDIVEGRWQPPR